MHHAYAEEDLVPGRCPGNHTHSKCWGRVESAIEIDRALVRILEAPSQFEVARHPISRTSSIAPHGQDPTGIRLIRWLAACAAAVGGVVVSLKGELAFIAAEA